MYTLSNLKQYKIFFIESEIKMFFLDPSVDISSLDIPVNAVATALKDFFSKRLPPLFTEDLMVELEDLSGKGLYIYHGSEIWIITCIIIS